MESIAIHVNKVSKTFKIPHEKSVSLRSTVFSIFKQKSFTVHEAANDISFDVPKGQFLGIIGRNGCGKSTMLKMLAGIYQPNKGMIKINGRLSPFLELGVGFNPELSARDNIYLNGIILGLSRREIDERFSEIIRFSELEEFIDQKLKNFSSGMQVRLAFAVAIQAHADILLIDEVLAVGDTNFQRKCLDVFQELKDQGKTIVFVSHNMEMIKRFCDRVILMDKAKIIYDGPAERATEGYEKLNKNESKEGAVAKWQERGGKEVEIISAKLNGNSRRVKLKKPGVLNIEVEYRNNYNQPVGANFSIGVDNKGSRIFDTSTSYFQKNGFSLKAKESGRLLITLDGKKLLPGDYDFHFTIFDENNNFAYHGVRSAIVLTIEGDGIRDYSATGSFNLSAKIKKA